MSADTPAADPAPDPSSGPRATVLPPAIRISPVALGLLAGFAVLATLVAFRLLPAHPDKSWITDAASNMMWIGVAIVLPSLVGGALYRWHPRLHTLWQYMLQHFGFARIGFLAMAILLPPALAFLIYGLLLLHSPSLWNQPLVAVLCGLLVAGGALALIAYAAGQLSIKEIQAAIRDMPDLLGG